METMTDFISLGSKITLICDCSHESKRCLLFGRKAMTNLDCINFTNKSPYSQNYGFSSSHVWMWELDHKEPWVLKNWSFQIVLLGRTLESPLDYREIKLTNPKGNQSWIFTGRIDAAAEAPVVWPSVGKNWLIRKDPDAGKDWRQEERGWWRMKWLDSIIKFSGLEFGQAPGDSEGQRNLTYSCMELQRVRHDLATEQNIIIVVFVILLLFVCC